MKNFKGVMMVDKRKGGPVRFIWHKASTEPISFAYEVEGSLEHVVRILQDFQPDPVMHFVVDTKSLSPTFPEYAFALRPRNEQTNPDDETIGRVFQVSETTCQLEGIITLSLWPIYTAFLILILGVVASFTVLKIVCGLPFLGLGFFLVYDTRPHRDYHRILELLEKTVQAVVETPHKINPHPIPKHSRPSNPAKRAYKQLLKRKRSS